MIYGFGIAGFICGFAFGLFTINIFLKSYKRKELLENKSLYWTYGLAVWLSSGIGVWAGLEIHGRYFS